MRYHAIAMIIIMICASFTGCTAREKPTDSNGDTTNQTATDTSENGNGDNQSSTNNNENLTGSNEPYDEESISDIERQFHLTAETTTLPLYPLAHNFLVQNWLDSDYFRISVDGALEKNYGERYDNAGWQYSPVAASQFCYTAYNEQVLTENQTWKEHVIQQAQGLLSRAERDDRTLLWRYNFSQATFGAEPGWISGMAQGLAMACFSGAGNTGMRISS